MNGNSKLTLEEAERIRYLQKTFKTSYSALAKQFNVSHGTIGAIIRNENYKEEFILFVPDVLKAANKIFSVFFGVKKVNYVNNLYGSNLERAIVSLMDNYLLEKKVRYKAKKSDIELIEKAHYQLITFGYISKQ